MIISLFTEYNAANGSTVTPIGKWRYSGPDITVLIGSAGSQVSQDLEEGDLLPWDVLIEFECLVGGRRSDDCTVEFRFRYILYEGTRCEVEAPSDFAIIIAETPVAKILDDFLLCDVATIVVCDTTKKFYIQGKAIKLSDGNELENGVIFRWYKDCVLLDVADDKLLIDPSTLAIGMTITYSLQLEYDNCISQTACVYVNVFPVPTAGAGASIDISEGTGLVNLQALAVSAGLAPSAPVGYSYLWRDPANIILSNPEGIETSFYSPGSYDFILEVRSDTRFSCSRFQTYTVNVI